MHILKTMLCAAAGVALMSSPANAQQVTDCPLRDAPFGADTPLIDILLSERATAAIEGALGMSFDDVPKQFISSQAPTFAAILTMTEASGMFRQPPEATARAIAALEAVEVTEADRIARCARYDNERPQFDLPDGKPAILVFEKINGFKDVPSFDAAHALLERLAEKNGWALVFTDKGGAMTPDVLSQFDAVIWNNISGDVLTLSQRDAFRDYIEGGGGYLGIHGSGGDPVYFWDWYIDTLIGARFAGHPRNPQFQEARLYVADADHPAAHGLPAEWRMSDEWYAFKTNPRDSGARVVLGIDESTYDPNAGYPVDLAMGEEHPLAWSKRIGQGRSFYTAIGHMPETYAQPQHVALLENAIDWAAGLSDCECED